MIRAFLILSMIVFMSGSLFAQTPTSFCGTEPFESESLEKWHAERPMVTLRSNDTFYVRMKVHLVGTDAGSGYYPINSLLESFCKLNQDMAQTKIQLEMDPDIHYIANSSYNDHGRQTGLQMMLFNNLNNRLNVYIVANPNGACGYYSNSGNAIALRKSCLGKFNTTWAHEVGHYFSLPHTFNGWEGTDYEYGDVAPNRVGRNGILVEKADGSNCATAADRFCDTDADYLSYRWTCFGGTSPDSLMDPDSTNFLVEGKYIMGYSNDQCTAIFTDEQISAMHFNIQTDRSDEQSNNPLPARVNFDFDTYKGVMGVDGEELQYDDATIAWPAMTNAESYVVQITKKLPFATDPDYILITQDTFLKMDFLEMDQTYEWEIMGFNGRYSCSEFTKTFEFEATELTASINPEVQADLSVYPNPTSSAQPLYISYNSPIATIANISIHNLNGKAVFKRTFNMTTGENNLSISGYDLQAGVYILQYQDERGFASRKLIIQD